MADPYIINWSSSLKPPISLPEDVTNSSSSSVVLTGRGFDNYGEIQQENFIRLLENFTSPLEPLNPTVGMLWYQTDSLATTGTLRIRSRSNLWEDVFPIPQASSTTRGLIKVGTTLILSADGTLNYNLPIASESVLGGVRVAANPNSYGLKISSGQSGGLLEYILPVASSTVTGGIKVATNNTAFGLKMSGEFLQYALPIAGSGSPSNASAVTLGGVRIKDGGGLLLEANGFLSSAIQSISPATASNLGGIKVGEGLSADAEGVLNVAVASNSVLGGIKVGNGLSINSEGVLSVGGGGGGGSGIVSSVAMSGGTTGLTFTGGPITSSGTFTAGGILQPQHGGTGVNSLSSLLNSIVPSQTGKDGSFLTTNGTAVAWSTAPNVTAKYTVLPGGVYMQWGTSPSITYPGLGGGTASITFPTAFPNACFGVQVTRIGTNSTSGNKRDSHMVTNVTATSFTLVSDYEELSPQTFYWLAYGN